MATQESPEDWEDWEKDFNQMIRDGVIAVGFEECGYMVYMVIRRPGKPPPNEVRFSIPQTEGSRLTVALIEKPNELVDRVVGRMKLVD